jgi:hypothetical protein
MKKCFFILMLTFFILGCNTVNVNQRIFEKKYNGYRVIESFRTNLLIQDSITGKCINLKEVSQYYMGKYNVVGSIINE